MEGPLFSFPFVKRQLFEICLDQVRELLYRVIEPRVLPIHVFS